MDWSLIWMNPAQAPCPGSPVTCPHLHHNLGRICQHCTSECHNIKLWRQNWRDTAEHVSVYISLATSKDVTIRNRFRILGPRSHSLEFVGPQLFEVLCENQPKFMELLRALLMSGNFPAVTLKPGTCLRRTLADVLPPAFSFMESEMPCLMLVLDQGQRPVFDKRDCLTLMESGKWETCTLQLVSALEDDAGSVEAEVTNKHTPWEVCELSSHTVRDGF